MEKPERAREHPLSPRRKTVQSCLMAAAIATLLTAALISSLKAGNGLTTAILASALTAAVVNTAIALKDAVRRRALETWTRNLADGQLDERMNPGGRDGTAMIAQAVERLRVNSVQNEEVRSLSEELQERNLMLEQVLQELRDAQDQMVSQQKLVELGEITKAVAHELRNPLQFISNFTEGFGELLEELDAIIPTNGSPMSQEELELYQEVRRSLWENMQYITAHGDRANRVVTRMQSIGHSTHENFEPRDINALVRQCAQATCGQQEAGRINIELDENFDPHMGEIKMIPSDFGQAIANITENAIQAVRDRYQDENDYQPAILLETRRKGTNAEIRIWDNGPGMRPETIERAFTPFFTTKPPHQGSGLGLTIANDIIREHRGTIIADSQPGEYTVFTISVPMGEDREIEFAREWEG